MPRFLSFVCDHQASAHLNDQCIKGGLAGKGAELEFYVDTAPVRLSQRFLAHKWIHTGGGLQKALCGAETDNFGVEFQSNEAHMKKLH